MNSPPWATFDEDIEDARRRPTDGAPRRTEGRSRCTRARRRRQRERVGPSAASRRPRPAPAEVPDRHRPGLRRPDARPAPGRALQSLSVGELEDYWPTRRPASPALRSRRCWPTGSSARRPSDPAPAPQGRPRRIPSRCAPSQSGSRVDRQARHGLGRGPDRAARTCGPARPPCSWCCETPRPTCRCASAAPRPRAGRAGEATEGTQVVVLGKPTFFTGRGTFSLRVSEIRAVGIGELLARIERLRRLLDAEGLFDRRSNGPSRSCRTRSA